VAVANSLRRFKPARGRWKCTINGIGERAGNASLEDLVMCLRPARTC